MCPRDLIPPQPSAPLRPLCRLLAPRRSLVTRKHCCKGCQGPVLRSIQVGFAARATAAVRAPGPQAGCHSPDASRFCPRPQSFASTFPSMLHSLECLCNSVHYLFCSAAAPCSALGGWVSGKPRPRRLSSAPALKRPPVLSLRQPLAASSRHARCIPLAGPLFRLAARAGHEAAVAHAWPP